ncbi:hypothetical protein CDL12_19699 [Handroanthus impetiginosus]|uniref:TFIIS N-terminal domain-containing protein n=1 Tax=Handroanthus impetiginosus TaxID=429701 RepID=A0A2G9GR37_9LAMI|nr:hypothetical protein CDL12_19699 [Handroanthus impetiginosus]
MTKKKVKNAKSAGEITFNIEHVMANLEVAAEDDAELNRQGKPAISKLKKLSLLTDALSKKPLQREFLDRGVFALLKTWLDPLPDGSLPNINIRSAILTVVNDFPIDLEDSDRRKQLKKSGLGKAIGFLAKSNEETAANRKLAKGLLDKWRALIPEAISMNFIVRPVSKVDPVEVRARAKHLGLDQHHKKLTKKLEQLRAPKQKQLQAIKLSATGHGMMKYI